jgi:dTDP-4-amino-4,6-dideoxygalactose transaminase
MKERINVTKTHLPPLEKFQSLVAEIWETGQLTNYGEKSVKLRDQLEQHLGVKHLILTSNGTIALQLAIKALELGGEIITTPFSYVATISSIVWEGCEPVFVDINADDYCINADKIEAAITQNTSAILATHVYGNPCAVDQIKQIADKHGLFVIYDAAHAFDVKLNGTSILNYGDISTLSFHATKVFHTGEGGAVVTNNADLAKKMAYLGNFGHKNQEEFWGVGINSKMSEFHAALGLCVLPHMPHVIESRKKTVLEYDALLVSQQSIKRMSISPSVVHNYAYYPVVLESELVLIQVRDALNKADIFPRRYFYPSLNKLPYLTGFVEMPLAEDIAKTVLCLPLSSDQRAEDTQRICTIIIENLK